MVAVGGLPLGDHLVDAGVALERGRVQRNLPVNRVQAGQPVLGVFERHPADYAVDRVSFLQQQLGEVGTILFRDAGDQRAPGGHVAAIGSNLWGGLQLSAVFPMTVRSANIVGRTPAPRSSPSP